MTKLQSPIALLKSAWFIYADRFWLFVKTILMSIAGMIPFAISMLLFLLISVLKLSDTINVALLVIAGLISLAAFLFGIYISLRFKAASYILCAEEKTITIKELFNKTKGLAWPFFVVSLGTAILVVLWSILFIIPGVIFAVFYAFSVFTLIFDKKSPGQALKHSKELVKGYWWPVFGRLVFIGVLIAVLSAIISAISSTMPDKSIQQSIWMAIGQIATTILSPVLIVYTYLLYKNLKETKEVKE